MNNNKAKIQNFIVINLIAIFVLLFAFEVKAEGWSFWKKKGVCEKLVEPITNTPLLSLLSDIEKDIKLADKKKIEVNKAKRECYQSILNTGDYKELYAYYKFYIYVDEALKISKKEKDEAPNNIYHYMLFYANQNSREFDLKTKSFKREKGLYEQELKTLKML